MRPFFTLVTALAALSDAMDAGVSRPPANPALGTAAPSRPAPAGMVWVPGGTFVTGAPGARHPVSVTVGAFWIDRTEVTVAAYARCVSAHRCEPARTFGRVPPANFPVTDVSFAMASAYCAHVAMRLPTGHEWELAARGVDGRAYPWGDRVADCARANVLGCAHGPVAAGSLAAGASPFGALDLAGNVAEWTERNGGADAHDDPLPDGGSSVGDRIARGGSFASSSQESRAFSHTALPDGEARFDTGFRCARSP